MAVRNVLKQYGTTDALIRQAITDAVAAGDDLYFPAATYNFSGSQLTFNGIKAYGDGPASSLVAATPSQSALHLTGNGAELRNMKISCPSASTRLTNGESAGIFIDGATNFKVIGMLVDHSASAGILNYGGSSGKIFRNKVTNTFADGIHNTHGAHDIEVAFNEVEDVGDDMFAIISYVADGVLCYSIDVHDNIGYRQTFGRGCTVVGGGPGIYIRCNKIQHTYGAGIYIACESASPTYGVNGVTVEHNIIRHPAETIHNTNILIYVDTADTGMTVTNVSGGNNDCDPSKTAIVQQNSPTNITVSTGTSSIKSTPAYIDGFEHALISTVMYDTIAGVPATNTVQVKGSSQRSVSVVPAGVDIKIQHAIDANLLVCRIGFYIGSAAAGQGGSFVVVLGSTNFATGQRGRFSIDLTNLYTQCRVNDSGVAQVYNQNAGLLSTGVWHTVDLLYDPYTSSTNHTIDWYVDGIAQTQATYNPGASVRASFVEFGYEGAGSGGQIYFDDLVIGKFAGDFPMIDCDNIIPILPNAVGVHNLDASPSSFFFQNDGTSDSALTSSEATSYTRIDEVPLGSDIQGIKVKGSLGAAQTVTKTFAFASNSEGFVANAGANSVLSWDGTTGNPAGSLKARITGRNKNNNNYWEWSGTWESLGVPAGSIVTAIRVDSAYTRCTEYVTGASSTIGPYQLYDNTPTLQATLWAGRTVTGTDASWQAVAAQANQSVPSAIQASSSTIRLRLADTLATGNSNSAAVSSYDDQVVFVITYQSSNQPSDTEYAEYQLTDSSKVADPIAIRAITAMHNSNGSNTNSVGAKIHDGSPTEPNTNLLDIFRGLNVATATQIINQLLMISAPSDVIWTTALLNASRLRLGYSNNADGDPTFDGIVLEALYPKEPSTESAIVQSKTSVSISEVYTPGAGGTNYTESATISSKTTPSISEIYTPAGGTAYTEAATIKSVTSIVSPQVSFPTTPILDDFNLADQGPPPDSNWLGITFPGDNGLVIVSGQVAHATGTGAGGSATYNNVFSGNVEFRLDVPVEGAAGIDYFITNRNTTNINCYRAQYSESGNEFQLYRVDNKVFTKIAGYALILVSGDSLGVRVINGSHQLMYKPVGSVSWVLFGAPISDSTYSAGQVGIFLTASSTIRGDNFGGGQIPLQEFVGFVESATVSGKSTVSSSEVYTPATGTVYTDAATVSNKTTPSSTETEASVDGGTIATKSNISISDFYAANDFSSVPSITSPAGSDLRSSVESGTVATTSQPSITDIQASTISATIPGVTTPVLVETRDRLDSAIVPGATAPSIVDIAAYVNIISISTISSLSIVDIEADLDSATTSSATTPSIIDISAYVDGTTTQSLTLVSSVEIPPQKLDSATCNSVTTSSIIEFTNYVDASLLTSASSPSIIETHEIPDNATISSKSTSTITDVISYIDQSTQTSTTTHISTSELFAGLDSNTIPGATIVLTSELAAYVDSAAPQNVTAPSITDTYIPAPQRLKPISNVAAGDWQPSDGTSQLYALISDDNDITYIYSTAT